MSSEFEQGLQFGFEADPPAGQTVAQGLPERDVRVEFRSDGTLVLSFRSDLTGRLHFRPFNWQSVSDRDQILAWIQYHRRESMISPDHADEIWVAVTAAILDRVAEFDRLSAEQEAYDARERRESVMLRSVILGLTGGLMVWLAVRLLMQLANS